MELHRGCDAERLPCLHRALGQVADHVPFVGESGNVLQQGCKPVWLVSEALIVDLVVL